MQTSWAVFLVVATASGSRLIRRGSLEVAERQNDIQIYDEFVGQGRTNVQEQAIVKHSKDMSLLETTNLVNPDVSPRRLPRRIWSAWLQGDPDCTAPYLNKVCLHMWNNINSNTWNFTMLTHRTIFEYFPELQEIFEREPRTLTAQSDLVRLYFLSKFGGVWVDASVLPVIHLDSFIDEYVGSSGFFAYRYPDRGMERTVSTWFMASYPGNALTEQWRVNFLNRWLHKKEFRYFEVHWTLKDMMKHCKSNPNVCAVWGSTLFKSNAPPYKCVRGCSSLFLKAPESKWPAVLKRPYRKGQIGAVPEKWWDEYFAAVRLERPKLFCNATRLIGDSGNSRREARK